MKIHRNRAALSLAALTMTLLTAGRAEAGLLSDTVHGAYYYPNTGSMIQNGGDLTVNPTAVFPFTAEFVDVTVTVSDTTISARFSDLSLYTPSPFNGFIITDVSRSPGIIGFSATSDLVGFTPSIVTFTDDSVSVNLQGLLANPGSTLDITLDFAPTAVPEPSTFAGAGLAGVFGLLALRRRRKASVA